MYLGMVKLKAHTDAISGNQSKQQFSLAFYFTKQIYTRVEKDPKGHTYQ